ncbi:FkbM family methyltransferase [Ensifer adhaerens]|uniref:FkbM family methyltransferase n=1 Tax=Ensifer adhaerens TaxID=106592 RepID=UPI003D08383B
MIKGKLLKRALRSAASMLTRQGFHVSEERYSAAYLKRYGFEINTFIDIGVYQGSPVFYELFKDKKFILIDPQPDTMEKAAESVKGLDFDYIQSGAGATRDTATLALEGPSSSLMKRRDWKRQAEKTVEIQIAPLDELLANKGYSGPFGLKVDTEGFDLDVLKGAVQTLRETHFVFTEASLRRRFEGGYRFSELVAFMAEQGFEVADVIPHRSHNRLVDVLFVRAGSPALEPNAVPVRTVG